MPKKKTVDDVTRAQYQQEEAMPDQLPLTEDEEELSICEHCGNETPYESIGKCEEGECSMDGLCEDCQSHDVHGSEDDE